MRARTYLIAAVVAVLLAVGSVAALAATRARPVPTSAGCAVPALPGQQVRVVLADMGRGSMMGGWMMLRAAPQAVRAGTVSLLAVNHGVRTHELLVLPLEPGATVGARPVGADNAVDETGSLGESSRGCGAGHGDGIGSGQVGWVTLTLRPGRYELVCNQPGHYAAGMVTELDVR